MSKMQEVKINSEFIKLDQFLKWTGAAESGADAKHFILEGMVKVNGEVDVRRGKKIYPEMTVEFQGKTYKVIAGEKLIAGEIIEKDEAKQN